MWSYMSFSFRAVSCVLCTCVLLSPAVRAQDKDAIAVAPMRGDDAAPHTEVGVRAAVPTHDAEPKAAKKPTKKPAKKAAAKAKEKSDK